MPAVLAPFWRLSSWKRAGNPGSDEKDGTQQVLPGKAFPRFVRLPCALSSKGQNHCEVVTQSDGSGRDYPPDGRAAEGVASGEPTVHPVTHGDKVVARS